MKKLNRNLTEEEKPSKWSKILSQVKVKVKRKGLGWKRVIRKVFVITNLPRKASFLCIAIYSFQRPTKF